MSTQGEAGDMPFIGRFLDISPGRSVVVERILDLGEDAFLADHAFVHAPGIKPLSHCLPVLPMTMSVEAMAEAAACVVPGLGLIGVENVKATRWIELDRSETATLKIVAKLLAQDPERDVSTVGATIHADGREAPSIEATFLFGQHYLVEIFPEFGALDASRSERLDAARLYADRRLFHGPAFQALTGEILLDDRSVVAETTMPATDGLFRSASAPQLLLQPVILDNLCQIVGVWAMTHERYAFPVGLGKLELYGPTPPTGARLPVRVELTKTVGKTIHADVEVEDGEGGVWMRIRDLASWKFQWERKVVDYRRSPSAYLLGRPASVGTSRQDAVCLLLAEEELGAFDARLLARDCLSVAEEATYESHARYPLRQRQWLLGRAAAKDCARLWLSRRDQCPMPHPAALVIQADEAGRPTLGAERGEVYISISHCESRALAAASDRPVGVDVERIAARGDDFLATFTDPAERPLLDGRGVDGADEWVARLWCAKEAVGKLLGVGLGGGLKSLTAQEISADGRILVLDPKTQRLYEVETVRDEEFVMSFAVDHPNSV